MNKEEIEEILYCLKGGRTLFHYYPDKYAAFLLMQFMCNRERVAVKDIRSSVYAKLLTKPVIKTLVSGDGYLYRDNLKYLWQPKTDAYVLTLGAWGSTKGYSDYQISRPGQNLVLQVNFSKQWSKKLEAIFGEQANNIFDCGHPISQEKEATLGWIRMDMDFSTGEVLIEEVQTDLLRSLVSAKRRAEWAIIYDRQELYIYGLKNNLPGFVKGIDELINQFANQWQEVLLTSALWFCTHELGMEEIYYHSFDTGNALKNMKWSKPPRSLYTQLPKQFCFTEQTEGPGFIETSRQAKRRLKKVESAKWFKMAS